MKKLLVLTLSLLMLSACVPTAEEPAPEEEYGLWFAVRAEQRPQGFPCFGPGDAAVGGGPHRAGFDESAAGAVRMIVTGCTLPSPRESASVELSLMRTRARSRWISVSSMGAWWGLT